MEAEKEGRTTQHNWGRRKLKKHEKRSIGGRNAAKKSDEHVKAALFLRRKK